ncbi:MAG: hypothetical protein AAF432_05500 [Planctomycetota bacterium]
MPIDDADTPKENAPDRRRMVIVGGAGAGIAVLTWFAVMSTPQDASAMLILLDVALRDAALAGAWLIAAIGYGLFVHKAIRIEASVPVILALGVASLIWLDNVLGRIGLLTVPFFAWIALAVGWTGTLLHLVRAIQQAHDQELSPRASFIWIAFVPAAIIIAIAASSAPGSLWLTEFNGYDALSYHLQLPHEWLLDGRIVPYTHNVYSALPSGMEGAFLHLCVLKGDAHAAAGACQWLHALLLLATAISVGSYAASVTNRSCGLLAAGIMLATPWSIVVGTLAYSEMATLLLCVGMIALLPRLDDHPIRTTVTIAWLAAATLLAKLSVAGLIVLPIGILVVIRLPMRIWLKTIPIGCVAGLIGLSPWLAGNAIALGQPTFPFLTDLFGLAHWDDEQARIWHMGHIGTSILLVRMHEAFDQFFVFGIGHPSGSAPWRAQWSVLPLLTIGTAAVAAWSRTHRRLAITMIVFMSVQLVFWMLFTHVKSRFMLPFIVPASICFACAAHTVMQRPTRWRDPAITLFLLVWSIMPIVICRQEPGDKFGMGIGTLPLKTGDALTPEQRRDAASLSPAIFVNHIAPAGSRVLLIGDAAPFYFDADRVDYTTVWDRGRINEVIRSFPAQKKSWVEAIRDDGYTHVLVQDVMLKRWDDAGWLDPALDHAWVLDAFRDNAQLITVYQDGSWLFELQGSG